MEKTEEPVKVGETVAERLMESLKKGSTDVQPVMLALSEGVVSLNEFSLLATTLSGNIDQSCNRSEPPGNPQMQPQYFAKIAAARNTANELRGYVVQIAIAKESNK